ncbi:MAG TPA: RodZ domain-containing protein [Anaerolineales bacterium]
MTQTIGQRLKAEREEQRITLEKAFEATRIRMQYLQALEEDDLSVMPSPVQARGYLRNYAEYLGFDVDKMLHELREQNAQQGTDEVIGPADSPASQSETKALELAADMPPQTFDLLPDPPAETPSIPIKPKPVRRKKIDSESTPATAEPPTRRRSRKKLDPEVVPSPEAEPAYTEDGMTAIELIPQPEQVGKSVTVVEPMDPVEAIAAEALDESQKEPAPVDVSDSLWQKWLNRVSSVLSARARRRTLLPNASPTPEKQIPIDPPDVPLERENGDAETYQQILKEIGRELRQRRELLSLHFDEVERNTHVKAYYLDALERGALDDLPSTVQTRGMLSNYATFLDLDVDVLLLRFADALQARHRERNPQKPPRKPGQPILANMPPVRSFIAGDMIFGIGMAILLVGFAIWGVNRVMTIQSQREIQPTAISISDVLLSSPDPSSFTATATFLPLESVPGEATVTLEIPTQNVNAEVQLNLVAVERTYLRVVVDGEVAFDGRVVPGNAYPFEAENQIEVLVGSGAAIRIVYNGRDLGLMGTFGQVVNNIYMGTEIITPTGLPTTTPTITPTPTRTTEPTATSKFTDTPAPSATAVP